MRRPDRCRGLRQHRVTATRLVGGRVRPRRCRAQRRDRCAPRRLPPDRRGRCRRCQARARPGARRHAQSSAPTTETRWPGSARPRRAAARRWWKPSGARQSSRWRSTSTLGAAGRRSRRACPPPTRSWPSPRCDSSPRSERSRGRIWDRASRDATCHACWRLPGSDGSRSIGWSAGTLQLDGMNEGFDRLADGTAVRQLLTFD